MCKTEQISVNQTEEKIEAALELADAFIRKQGITGKTASHVRLLTEETLGMVRAMTHDFQGMFWLEQAGEGTYVIRLSANTDMDLDKKEELLSVSRSGENASAKGIMGKIGELIENGILYFNDVMKYQTEGSPCDPGFIDYVTMGFCMPNDLTLENPQMMQAQMIWSLNQYRQNLENVPEEDRNVQEAWDELEKSIVASLAKDVMVGVKNNQADLAIYC